MRVEELIDKLEQLPKDTIIEVMQQGDSVRAIMEPVIQVRSFVLRSGQTYAYILAVAKEIVGTTKVE